MDGQTSFADDKLLAAISPDQIGHVTINRPEKKNALTDQMWRALPQAMAWLTAEKRARVIILQGAGERDFCAGADIAEFETLRKDATTARQYEAGNSAAFASIRTCPVPVIAAIRGICFGGGFGLAAAADLRIADDTARFAIPAARLGLAYPLDAVPDLVRALGDQAARRALYSAQELTAHEARTLGCVMTLCAPEDLDAEVAVLAAAIARAAPRSVRASKAAIAAHGGGAAQELSAAARLADGTFDSRDYAEGRAAFLQKREARFTGD